MQSRIRIEPRGTPMSLAVSRIARYLLVIMVILAAVVVCDVIFAGHLLPRILIQPSPDAITDTFLDAITAGDLDLVLSLTDGILDCVANMTRTFEWYSPNYLGVPVDEIILSYYFWSTDAPSQETISFTFSDRDNWPATAGVVTPSATYSMFGKRYTCGSVFTNKTETSLN